MTYITKYVAGEKKTYDFNYYDKEISFNDDTLKEILNSKYRIMIFDGVEEIESIHCNTEIVYDMIMRILDKRIQRNPSISYKINQPYFTLTERHMYEEIM